MKTETCASVNPNSASSIGATVRVVLDTDEKQAYKRGTRAWRHLDTNLTKLWRRFGIDDIPANPTANGDFDQALAMNMAFAGTPAAFTEFVNERAELGIDPLVLGFEFGDLTASEVRVSFDLFAEQVMQA